MVEPQSAGVGIASEISDGVAVIRLTSPETANAFEPGDMLRLAAAIKTASCAESVRALILIGSGQHFCAGASFNGLAGAQDMDDLAQAVRDDVLALQAAFDASPVVTIAAVNGLAAGAGSGIALMADLMLVASSSRLMFPFAKIGLVPDTGLTHSLARRIGEGRAMALFITGGALSAKQCVDHGLALACHADDEFFEESLKLAGKLAAMPKGTHVAIRKLIARAGSGSSTIAIDAEAEAQSVRFSVAETQQAINALVGKI
jgi:2-(1,2-epoxy-1,2-dihydrophenyl)acetyl-CoA isomerase